MICTLNAEDLDTLEITAVIAPWFYASLFQLVRDICGGQTQPFRKGRTAFKIIRCQVSQPRSQRFRRDRKSLSGYCAGKANAQQQNPCSFQWDLRVTAY